MQIKRKSVLRKVLAVSLSAVMLLGTGFTTVGQFVGTGGISVSATVGSNFAYSENKDENGNENGTVTVWGTADNYDKISINIPSSIDGKTVTTVSDHTSEYYTRNFRGNKDIISVSIPNTVKTIRTCAFYGCSSIIKLNLGNGISKIETSAFRNCTNLRTVTLPDSLTKLDTGTFSYCDNLEIVNIGSGL